MNTLGQIYKNSWKKMLYQKSGAPPPPPRQMTMWATTKEIFLENGDLNIRL
jgi:hypothetical protein